MAKNVSLLGANYPDVPAVQLPQTGGGTATFYDIQVIDNLNSSSATDALSANQGKVLDGKITDTNNRIFGGREYASDRGDGYCEKTISLPAIFSTTDVNNYFVSVTPLFDVSAFPWMFVSKATGQFTVYFKFADQQSDAKWFDYSVIIND